MVQTDQMKPAVIAVGVLLIALFVAGLVLSRAVGGETTEKTTPGPCTGTTTTTTSCTASQEKTTQTKSFPSEALLTALLTTGGVLILVGLFFGRITSIKAFGAELGLAPRETDKVVKKVTEKLKDQPEKVGDAIPAALNQARAVKQTAAGATLSDRTINALASNVAEQLRTSGDR